MVPNKASVALQRAQVNTRVTNSNTNQQKLVKEIKLCKRMFLPKQNYGNGTPIFRNKILT